MESRLTKANIDEMIFKIGTLYEKELAIMERLSKKRNSAGKIRQRKGDLVNNIVFFVLDSISKLYKDQNIKIKIIPGEKDKKLLKSKHGEYKHSQDLHLYLNRNFILSIETKSYTESAMYKRVCEDARLLKKYINKELYCILVEFECARDDRSQTFMDEEYGTIDKIFTLAKGKRSSSKPIHKSEFHKELDKKAITDMIISFDKFLILKFNELK